MSSRKGRNVFEGLSKNLVCYVFGFFSCHEARRLSQLKNKKLFNILLSSLDNLISFISDPFQLQLRGRIKETFCVASDGKPLFCIFENEQAQVRMAYVSFLQDVKIFDFEQMKVIRQFSAHKDTIFHIESFRSTSIQSSFFTAAKDNLVKFWNPRERESLLTIDISAKFDRFLFNSVKGRDYFVMTYGNLEKSKDQPLVIYDLLTLKHRKHFNGLNWNCNDLQAFSNHNTGSNLLLMATNEGTSVFTFPEMIKRKTLSRMKVINLIAFLAYTNRVYLLENSGISVMITDLDSGYMVGTIDYKLNKIIKWNFKYCLAIGIDEEIKIINLRDFTLSSLTNLFCNIPLKSLVNFFHPCFKEAVMVFNEKGEAFIWSTSLE